MTVTQPELTELVVRICRKLNPSWLAEHAPAISLEYDPERGLYNLEKLARTLGIPEEAVRQMHLQWVQPDHMELFLKTLLERLEPKPEE